MSIYKILKKPITTEKTSKCELKNNCYTFEVYPNVTKIDVKKAILDIYGLEVESVNIVSVREKYKYGRKGVQYKRRPLKKVYVVLKDNKAKLEYSVIK